MFMPQIKPKYFEDIPFVEAAKWILTGFFFKLYVANNLNEMTSYMDFPLYETLQTQDRWLLVFLYSYQIYADFFGYSAIAIGLALLFGYRLPVNFNLPYISVVVFRILDALAHLLVKLAADLSLRPARRQSPWRFQNLSEFDDCDGAWWSLARRRAWLPYVGTVARRVARDRAAFHNAPAVDQLDCFSGGPHSFVFVCVTMLWIFFKLPNFDHAISYLSGMFTPSTNPNPTETILQSGAALFAAGHDPASCFPLVVRANAARR